MKYTVMWTLSPDGTYKTAWAVPSGMAMDDDRWVTIKAGAIQGKGRHMLIDEETGIIKKGVGGALNGQNIDTIHKSSRPITEEQYQARKKRQEERRRQAKPASIAQAKNVVDLLYKEVHFDRRHLGSYKKNFDNTPYMKEEIPLARTTFVNTYNRINSEVKGSELKAHLKKKLAEALGAGPMLSNMCSAIDKVAEEVDIAINKRENNIRRVGVKRAKQNKSMKAQHNLGVRGAGGLEIKELENGGVSFYNDRSKALSHLKGKERKNLLKTENISSLRNKTFSSIKTAINNLYNDKELLNANKELKEMGSLMNPPFIKLPPEKKKRALYLIDFIEKREREHRDNINKAKNDLISAAKNLSPEERRANKKLVSDYIDETFGGSKSPKSKRDRQEFDELLDLHHKLGAGLSRFSSPPEQKTSATNTTTTKTTKKSALPEGYSKVNSKVKCEVTSSRYSNYSQKEILSFANPVKQFLKENRISFETLINACPEYNNAAFSNMAMFPDIDVAKENLIFNKKNEIIGIKDDSYNCEAFKIFDRKNEILKKVKEYRASKRKSRN